MKTSWIVRGGLVGLSGLILYLIARADKKAAEKQEAYWKKQDEEIKQMEEQFKEDMKTMSKIHELIDIRLNSTPSDSFDASIELAREVGVPENDILKTLDDVDKFFLE